MLGLIDAIVPPEELLKVSREWALDIANERKPWVRSLHNAEKIGSLSESKEIIKFARLQAKRIAPNMTHPQACLDVIEEGIVQGGYPGVLKVCLVTFPPSQNIFNKVHLVLPKINASFLFCIYVSIQDYHVAQ